MKHELAENLTLALDALRANKLRSSLTILGVVVGVMTIIGMVALIQGLNKSMAGQIEALGSNVIYVFRHQPGVRFGPDSEEERNRKRFTLEDAIALRDECPALEAVSPENHLSGGSTIAWHTSKAKRVDQTGVWPTYENVNNTHCASGRFINDGDMARKSNVCVLGQDVVDVLFPGVDPIGQEVLTDGLSFTVIGVAEPKGKFLGNTQDKFVLIPYTTFQKYHSEEWEIFIAAKPKSKPLMETAMDEMREVLRRRRKVPSNKPDDFALVTQESLLQLYNSITGAFFLVMVVISSIGLLVGGIGVMDIMLVSVTERTREIGVRKAVGARRRDILLQFLIEAVTLCAVGGAIGILAGIGIAKFVSAISPLPSVVPWWSVILGFGFSSGVGIFFGVWPAVKAARLDPIAALRCE